MEVIVSNLMRPTTAKLYSYQSMELARVLSQQHRLPILPIVNTRHELEGVVTSEILSSKAPGHLTVDQFMETGPLSIPGYLGVHVAARVMRNYDVPLLIVTNMHKVPIGLITALDLLMLVENRHFIPSRDTTPPKKANRRWLFFQ